MTLISKKTKRLLKTLEKTSKKFWNIEKKSGKFLNLLIKDLKIKTVLEIGTSNGYSGIWLAEALSHTKGHLYTMESHKKRFSLASKNFKKSGLSPYITQILGHAPENIPHTPRYFDLVFFDATKHEHKSYFHVLENRIRKGGVIITDNVISHKKELTPYTKTLQKNKTWHSVILPLGTGLMISVKK